MLYPLSYGGPADQGTQPNLVLGSSVSGVTNPSATDAQLQIVESELERALMGTTKWNEKRIPVLRGTFQRLLSRVEIPTSSNSTKPILEIGSDGQLASAKVLCGLSGLEVVASNLVVKGMESRVGDYPITVKQNDIGALDFPDDSFSMVYGRAVLEHISDMDDFLLECDRVLETGGVLYLDGGPLFHSPRGHHMAVKGPSGTHYGFSGMPDLLPNWCQLDSNEDELFEHLTTAKDIGEADARVIAEYVFNSPEQNRMSATMVKETFARSPFAHLDHEPTFMKKAVPPPHLVEQYGEYDLTCNGLAFFGTSGPQPEVTSAPDESPGAASPARPLWRRAASKAKRTLIR